MSTNPRPYRRSRPIPLLHAELDALLDAEQVEPAGLILMFLLDAAPRLPYRDSMRRRQFLSSALSLPLCAQTRRAVPAESGPSPIKLCHRLNARAVTDDDL